MARAKKISLQCEECENNPPALMAENQEAFECFTLCDSQLRVGMGGAYALDWNTTAAVARSLRMDTDEDFYRKLKIFEMVMLEEINRGKEE